MSELNTTLNLEAYFKLNGFPTLKAILWAQFIMHVVELLNKASDELQVPANWEHFKGKTGALGKAKKKVKKGIVEAIPNEDAITSELHKYIQNARCDLPNDHFLRLHEVSFQAEAPVKSNIKAGRHLRKVDFHIYSSSGLNSPEVSIEAKPLLKLKDIRNRYLGEEGIGCFLNLEPYTTGPLGGMFAYTINNEKTSLYEEINTAISEFEPKILSLDKVSLSKSCKNELMSVSKHERSELGLGPILVLHLERIFEPDIKLIPT